MEHVTLILLHVRILVSPLTMLCEHLLIKPVIKEPGSLKEILEDEEIIRGFKKKILT